jgi:hypothetical protein
MIGALGQSNWEAFQPDLANWSGANTILGGVYQLDLLAANAATLTTDAQLDNMITPTTAGIASSVVFGIAMNAGIANGFRTNFCVRGPILALLNGTVAVGDNLIAINAQNYLQTNAGTGPGICCAKAVVANTSGPNLGLVFMNGTFARMNQGTT